MKQIKSTKFFLGFLLIFYFKNCGKVFEVKYFYFSYVCEKNAETVLRLLNIWFITILISAFLIYVISLLTIRRECK